MLPSACRVAAAGAPRSGRSILRRHAAATAAVAAWLSMAFAMHRTSFGRLGPRHASAAAAFSGGVRRTPPTDALLAATAASQRRRRRPSIPPSPNLAGRRPSSRVASSPSDSNRTEDPAGPLPNDRPYARQFSTSVAVEPVVYRPIGVASSPFEERHGAPRQPRTEGPRGDRSGSFVLLPDNLGGPSKARAILEDLSSFSHVIALGHLHLNTGWSETVIPPRLRHLPKEEARRGLLSTRAPHRPNPIGLSVLELDRVDLENLTIHVRQTDFIDGTPILDIKPYIRQFDSFPTAKSGWVDDVEQLERRGLLPRVAHDDGRADREASSHRKSYRVAGIGRGSSTSLRTDTGHAIKTDLPKKMGGSDGDPQPVELLLGSLIGCAQATAVYVGRMMSPRRLLIDRIEFELVAHRDERGALDRPIDATPTIPARLQVVSGTARVYLRNDEVMEEEELELLAEQTEARCPVANMMTASGCAMDINWIDGNAAVDADLAR